MTIESFDAMLSILATCVPLVLAVLSSVLGLRARRQASDLPPMIIGKLAQEHEDAALARKRRRNQVIESVFGLTLIIVTIVYVASLLARLLPEIAAVESTSAVIIAALLVPVLGFYATFVALYLRTLWMFARTPVGTASDARASTEIVLYASYNQVLYRCQEALQQLRTTRFTIDGEQGVMHARKHYYFNLYKVYFDDVIIRLRLDSDECCTLTITSDGIMPTFRSDAHRNHDNIRRFIDYLTR